MNVLIVDDDPTFRRILKEILSQGDFPDMSIWEAEDGAQTLEVIESHHPILVFMDVKLPDTNGLALTRLIKGMAPKTTVVVVTNHDTPDYREVAFESGAAGFISKDASLANEFQQVIKDLDIYGGAFGSGSTGFIG